MIESLRRLLPLQPDDPVMLARCLIAVVYVEISWNVLDFGSLVRAIRMQDRAAEPPADADAVCRRAQLWLNAAFLALGRRHATCLQRAFALSLVLRSLGIASLIRLGVRNITADFAAHAWVEALDGGFIADSDHGFEPAAAL